MTVDGCRALCWATFVLFFTARLMLLWTATASAPQVPVSPYRFNLLRRHVKTESAKPDVSRDAADRRKQESSAKAAAVTPATGKAKVTADRADKKLRPVVAFLKAVVKQAKPRVGSDIQRTTSVLRKALAKRKKSRHKKRGTKNVEVITIHKPGSSSALVRRRSKATKRKTKAREGDYYHDMPYSDNYDDPYYYPDTSSYHEDDHAEDGGYADEYSDATYNEDPYHDKGYEESSYHESDGYQGSSADEYDGDGKYEQDDYHDAQDSGYEQDSYSESSDQEAHSYQETTGDGYDQEEGYAQPSYHDSESDDYHQGHDSGYDEDSLSESSYSPDSYDTGSDDSYGESYPQDYDDASSYPQPYQPADEQPTYEENSYLPDYQPTYSSSSYDESYPEYDQSYSESSSHDEAAHKPDEYPEETHSDDYDEESSYAPSHTDYDCPSPRDDFCYGKESGHYTHPATEHCFIQCDHVGRAFSKLCAYGTSWKSHGDEPAYANMCS